MVVYFIISLVLLIASAFLLFEHITVTAASVVSLVLIGVSILQAVIFKLNENEKEQDFTSNTMYTSHKIDSESTRLGMKYHSLTKLAIIPLLCPFVIYFDSVWKIVIPIIIYLISFLPVKLLIRLEQRKK